MKCRYPRPDIENPTTSWRLAWLSFGFLLRRTQPQIAQARYFANARRPHLWKIFQTGLRKTMKVGRYHIDIKKRRLMLESEDMNLGARAFDILTLIVAAGGRLITRDELVTAVWKGVVVEDGNLDVHLCVIRKKLGSDRNLIITVPRRGYRFATAENGALDGTTASKIELSAGAQESPAHWEMAIDLLREIMESPVLKPRNSMRNGLARARAARPVSAAGSAASRLRCVRSNLTASLRRQLGVKQAMRLQHPR
ncbi:winged helix-turn-helix domain-containing protein [Paraburkholderia graminis]|uniref:winged helix-turn-helix domain-containing protein n=1 Tax=Paraburkholderia graminis TaxID=60548 RepID=UPI002794390B|nr:winged helix-turn-helix domain-containing protein [Paraburkholderia graminis]MDQ0621935.1 DNA-binding winged helix-turn-helix (wHTH) protein [Paraburkholderia graminis]